jgi:hypothetical protein
MYAIIESSESQTMRRHHRRTSLLSLLTGFAVPRNGAVVSLIEEADKLEALYGDNAVAHVREKVQAADRKNRKRLYRLHDELARRRRQAESGDEFAGLMA